MKKIFRLSSIKEVLTIVVNKLKKNKRKVVIGLSAFLVVFISVFSFINLRYPTKINAYIAHVINKGRPANKYFDDENFYKAVVDAYNKENKTSLSYTTNLTDKQLKNIKSVSYDGYGKSKIKSTAGIEKLTSLTFLHLNWNNLSSIDLSKNTSLTTLSLIYNNLSSIDLSKNTSLTKLYLYHNNLSDIDLSKNTALKELNLYGNNLSSIDLSKNTALKELDLDGTNLSSIDLSKNTSLTSLYLYGNNLSNIDLSKNTALKELNLYMNNLSSIDLSKNTALTTLVLHRNNLSSIDLSKNTALIELDLHKNNLSSIDLSKNTYLSSLNLSSNKLSNIELSKNTYLSSLNLSSNKLSNIDLSKNTSLTYLELKVSNLSSIDLSKNKYLTKLYLDGNNLSNIDLSKNTALKELNLYMNNLSSIDLSKNTSLKFLHLDGNKISSIDLSKNTSLEFLHLDGNKISSIDLSKNTALKDLSLTNNNFINKLYLRRNETYKLPIILPEQLKNKYVVNDKNVASFNNNVITGVNVGTTSTTLDSTISNITINVYDITSNKYKINNDKKYIYTKNDVDSNTILSNIDFQYINGKIEDNKLILYHDDVVEEEYKIINISSNTYDLTKDYIYDNNFNKDNINVVNGSLEEKDNTLNIKYNDEILESKKIVKITSDKYDLTKDYIYNVNNSFDVSDIKCINCKAVYENNKLTIKYNDDVLKEIDVVSINFESSEYDLSKDYIYIGTGSFDESKIKSENITYEIENNILKLKYKDELLKSYKLVSVSSDVYQIKDKYLYVFDSMFDKSNIKVTNGTFDAANNKVIIKYDKDKLDEFDIVGISSSVYDLRNGYILLKTNEKLDLSLINTANVTLDLNGDTLNVLFNEEVIRTYKIVRYESSKYDLTKDYIYLGTKKFNKGDMVLENCIVEEKDNMLNIKYGDEIVRSYKLVRVSSNNYKVGNGYVYTKNEEFNSNLLDVTNASIEEQENSINIIYGKDKLDEFKLLKVTSDKYDLTKDYIYDNNFNKDNIKVTNVSLEEKDNTLNIKYNDEILDSKKIVKITSNTYDLAKDYIYIGNKELDKSKFNLTNCTLQVDNSTLNIKYDNDVLKSYKLVKIYSNTYDLNKNYIYVGNGIFDKNLLSVINGTVNVLNDKIEIKYNNDVLKEFKLLKYSSNKYDLTKEYIYLGINNFDKNNISLVNLSLNIDDNYNLNIKYGDDVMKTYKLVSVSSSKYDLSKDNIRVTKSDGLDLKDIKVANGTKKYLDNKLYIKYNDDILKVYSISTRAKGDITGDDKITIADVSLLYRHVRKTKVITDSETLEISDLTGDGKITIADVAKLYRYVRGKITEL